MEFTPAGSEISTILRHDSKQTSYKIALLRSINDVVLNYPDLDASGRDVAVPLLTLAERWISYYWPFVEPGAPIFQGPRAVLDGELRNDMAFRPSLAHLRSLVGKPIIQGRGHRMAFFWSMRFRSSGSEKRSPRR